MAPRFADLSAQQLRKGKVSVCHHHGGSSVQHHLISISEAALDVHLAHGDQLPPCPGGTTSGGVAGTGAPGFSGDGGPAQLAQINAPTDLETGHDGSLYFVDAGNRRIRRISPQGVITTVAGNGQAPSIGPDDTYENLFENQDARLSAIEPGEIALAPDGTLYFVHDTQFAPIIANYVFPQNKCLDDAEGTVSSISCRVLGYLWVLPEYFDIISCAAQHGKKMTRILAAAGLGRLANKHKHLKIDAISVILSEFQCAVTPSVKAAFYQALLEALDVPLTNRLTPNQILSFGDSDIQAHYLQLATDLTSSGK